LKWAGKDDLEGKLSEGGEGVSAKKNSRLGGESLKENREDGRVVSENQIRKNSLWVIVSDVVE
tara:strand:- start:289 stop:477 length:189 start_codon:yes stop_codon:yes gene_type:complete